MSCIDYKYQKLLKHILEDGVYSDDRTNVGTKSIFGYMLHYDMGNGFPLLTIKNVYFKAVAHELLWFISGSTNIKYLKKNDIKIWDEWADQEGNLGPVYGKQWRDNNGVDQLQYCIDQLKVNPTNRRLLVDSWRPELLPDPNIPPKDNVILGKQALPPCHYSFQFNSDGEYLDLMWNQRSVDSFLGLPFNIASYALLLEMVAQITGLKSRKLIGSLGNVHIYNNHREQVNEVLSREPINNICNIELNKDITNIDSFSFDDIKLLNYKHLGTVSAPIAV